MSEPDFVNAQQLPSLCGDCLRVRTFASFNEQEATACECGAEPSVFCMCEGCQMTVDDLRAGSRGNVPGLVDGAYVVTWSETDGATFAEKVTDAEPFELMVPVEDGWTEWVHPLPGYQMKCCDCGLVHDMQFAIAPSNGETAEFNEGEDDDGLVVFRTRRGAAVPSPSAPAAPCPSPEMGEGR